MSHPDKPNDHRSPEQGLIRIPSAEETLVFGRRQFLGGALGLGITAAVASACDSEGKGGGEKREDTPKIKPGEKRYGPERKETIPGTELIAKYKDIIGADHKNETISKEVSWKLNKFVLEQVANGNVPEYFRYFQKLEIQGKDGSVLEVRVAKHNLRLGTDEDWIELPLSAQEAVAAAELFGCTIETSMLHKEIHRHAHNTVHDGNGTEHINGGLADFFTYCTLAKTLDPGKVCDPDKPDGTKMWRPEYIAEVNRLRQEWMKQHGIRNDRLTAQYFKGVIHPKPDNDGRAGHELVIFNVEDPSTVKPKDQRWKFDYSKDGYSQSHERLYFDYSHGVRFVDPIVRLSGPAVKKLPPKLQKKVEKMNGMMTLNQFCSSSAEVVLPFGQHKMPIKLWPYGMPQELLQFMAKQPRVRPDWVDNPTGTKD